MTTNPNEPIHPNPLSGEQVFYGLTKREHIATQLLQGFCTNGNLTQEQSINKAIAWTDTFIAALNRTSK